MSMRRAEFVADRHVWFLNTGTGAPYLVDVVKEDGEHLVVSKVPGPIDSSHV
jgi:hypothetical protein